MCAIPQSVSAPLNPSIPTAEHFRRSHPQFVSLITRRTFIHASGAKAAKEWRDVDR